MPAFTTSVSHALGQATATDRLKAFLDEVRRDHADKVSNLKGEWQESKLTFAFTTYGMAITGGMMVEETLVQVSGQLPLAAAFFRGQIEQTIRSELVKLLNS